MRSTTAHLGRNLPWKLAGGLALLLLAPMQGAGAGSSVVSANPHRLTCNAPNPPQLGIVTYSGVEAVAYHVDATLANNCDVNTALAFASQGKPKIISDDISEASAAQVNPKIDQVANAGEHYEHFAAPMDLKLVNGQVIDGIEDFDAESLGILDKLGTRATRLFSFGTLTQSGTEFLWNGQQVALMGFSVNPILVSKNVDLQKYLDVLAGKGVNLLRVDAVSQWAALEVGGSPPELDPAAGLTPFAVAVPGSPGTTLTTKWNLSLLNDEYFARARDLVQLAAERGIVVQFSVFDRHGLLNVTNEPGLLRYGRFSGSPYNMANNQNSWLAAGPTGKAPPGFTNTGATPSDFGSVTTAYMQRLVREIGAYGNVIFEIMNEPLESANDWTNTVAWHQWVADRLNTELATPLVSMPIPKTQSAVPGATASFTVLASGLVPSYQWQRKSGGGPYLNLVDDGRIVGSQAATLRISALTAADAATYRCLVGGVSPALNSGPATLAVAGSGLVVRDGFGTGEGSLLQGRVTEAGAKTWSADNAKISGQKVRSNNENDAEKSRLLGSVPVSLAGMQTASVGADVRQMTTGLVSVGFRSAALDRFESGATGNSLFLDMTRGGSLTLKKRVSGVVSTLRTVDLTTLGFTIDTTVHLRLVYKVSGNKADVYVNHVKRLNDVALGFAPSTAWAGFQGRRPSAADQYLEAHGEVDNFEAVLTP